jgi:hypothetical protein
MSSYVRYGFSAIEVACRVTAWLVPLSLLSLHADESEGRDPPIRLCANGNERASVPGSHLLTNLVTFPKS